MRKSKKKNFTFEQIGKVCGNFNVNTSRSNNNFASWTFLFSFPFSADLKVENDYQNKEETLRWRITAKGGESP